MNSPKVSPPRGLTRSENARLLGPKGERAAAVFLVANGCRVLDRNWRYGRVGELDLVVDDGGVIVFVEVKTRSGTGPDTALAAVDQRKLDTLLRLGNAWLAEHHAWRPCRFDLVGVQLRAGREPLFAWLQDVAQ